MLSVTEKEAEVVAQFENGLQKFQDVICEIGPERSEDCHFSTRQGYIGQLELIKEVPTIVYHLTTRWDVFGRPDIKIKSTVWKRKTVKLPT